jgi:hypothetical protein
MTATESPPTRSGGPRGTTPENRPSASTEQTEDVPTVPVRTDTLQAAARLVLDAGAARVRELEAARVQGHGLGREEGYAAGYADGFDAGQDVGAARALLLMEQTPDVRPRSRAYAEHRARTALDDAPCTDRCRRCSRCVRAAAVETNQRLYGQADMPPQAERRAA